VKVAIVPVTPFQQNCSILVDEETGSAAVVDPGGDLDRLMKALGQTGATLERILLTHGHLDHCSGAAELRRRTGAPIEGPQREDGSGSSSFRSRPRATDFRRPRPSSRTGGWRTATRWRWALACWRCDTVPATRQGT
jgi:glyoxylase-like metal-dependent hydrolase (beta-lactamase superfamily II)